MAKHAKYSPSKLSRILKCPGSVDFIDYLRKKGHIPPEDQDTNEFAEEGSMLHDQIERLVNNEPLTESLDAEQHETIQRSFEWLLSLEQIHRAETIQTETKVTMEGYGIDNCYGTADIIMVGNSSVHVLDWKFGRGVPVTVDRNVQLMTYLAATMKNMENLEKFVSFGHSLWIHIAQPRLNYFGSYNVSLNELKEHIENLREALDSHDILASDDGCFWCPAKPRCGEYHEFTQDRAVTSFREIELFKNNEISLKQAVKVLKHEAYFTKAFNAIKAELHKASDAELKAVGMKKVEGRSIRKWAFSEDEVALMLGDLDTEVDDIYTMKLKSLATLEKEVPGLKKDEGFKALWFKPVGKPIIVPESDPRKEYGVSAEVAFKHLAKKKK